MSTSRCHRPNLTRLHLLFLVTTSGSRRFLKTMSVTRANAMMPAYSRKTGMSYTSLIKMGMKSIRQESNGTRSSKSVRIVLTFRALVPDRYSAAF